jgi:hypothetical protein
VVALLASLPAPAPIPASALVKKEEKDDNNEFGKE